ncbi:MAG: LacI family DNA-binding transcriptional regulator [Bacteroidota bacterium]|nr:LacI family DNA-binding transcriptional regulator [Bacteroidota bacterium]MDP4218219.1 LacI family DNA-binding transcriptional regulator [Bacteroidota bacterium]MDP4253486.1 LacI family DNA-binding transcriptional regulator [Bacteroidota bacterium]MDP4259447.1 LacI family DNA-binding transcriptional regulator [Bacteroidota bacterium]
MIPKKDITIYDIARVLNLSPATVSRGLKDHPAINIKTRKKITEMAKEMGYRSNNFASNLRRQKTNTIGIIVHELNSNFITSVLAGIEKVTTEAGYDLIIGHSSETYKKEAANAHNLFHKRVDGLIASLAFDTRDLDHFDPYVQKGIPIVFFDRVEEHHYGTRIIIDNVKAGYEATSHLIARGCRNIAHITANLNRNVYADRLKGYQQALKDNGLPFEPANLLVNDLGEDSAIRSAKQVLAMAPRPDGVFITNDFCAAVFLHAVLEAGVDVPGDLAIVGFNNDAISKITVPQLTTINYPGEEMGERAARSLVDQLAGLSSSRSTDTIIIRSELLVRGSTQPR